MRDAAERQIVSLDMIVDRHSGQFRHQTEMPADQSLDQAGMREAIEAAIGTVAGRRGEYQREITGFSGLDESPLQRPDDFVGRSNAYKTGRGDRVAGADDGDRLLGVDDLVAHQASPADVASRAISQSAMLWLSLPCDLLETNSPTCPPGSGISV